MEKTKEKKRKEQDELIRRADRTAKQTAPKNRTTDADWIHRVKKKLLENEERNCRDLARRTRLRSYVGNRKESGQGKKKDSYSTSI